MRFLPILFLFLMLLIAPPARAVPPPLTADFTIAPAAPAPGETVTFTSTSLAPGGGVIATEWDLDGDGEFDDGRKPVATRAFEAGTHTVRLKARLGGPVPHTDVATKTLTVAAPAATPEPTVTPDPTPAATPTAIPTTSVGCETSVQRGLLSASGECLRRDGDHWRSAKPVKVNGITITPAVGREVYVRVNSIQAQDGTATFTQQGETVTVDSGRIWWRVTDGRFDGVILPAGTKVGGLPIVALAEKPRLVLGGGTTFAFTVQMPQQFGAPTSDKPMRVTVGGVRAVAAADDGFHFEVENAVLGPIQLHKLSIDYDGNKSWRIEGDATLPPPADARVRAGVGVKDGAFEYAHGGADFLGQGFNIIGPVFLRRIAFRVEIDPQESECVPNIGVKPLPGAGPLGGGIVYPPGMPQPATTRDYGIPSFALCGEVGLVAGPTILGTSALSLDAGLGFALFDDRPWLLRAFGEIKIAGISWADAQVELRANGYIEADGRVMWPWPGVGYMKGELGLEMRGSQFNAHGSVEACVAGWCAASARAVVSNAGVAVCLKLDLGVTTWHPGLGYKWGETPTVYLGGCELGPYKTRVSAAQADGPRSVTVPAGLPGAAIALVGREAPPTVTLVGPGGERFTTPTGAGPHQQNPFFVLKDPASRTTQILIGKPSAGEWRVIPEPGSSAITEIKSAEGRRAPKVTAKIERRGGKRVLSYRVTGDGKVTFAERGATAGAILGKAKGTRGTIAFDPADGRAERRHIVAIIEQAGLPSAQVAVATYRAPAVKRPARVRGVETARQGGRVRVSWRKDDAPAHIVTVELSDGRRLVRRVEDRSALTLKVARGLRAKATVRAVARNGMLSR